MKNKQQKLKELIKRIRELLPRLMELKKGCKLGIKNGDFTRFYEVVFVMHNCYRCVYANGKLRDIFLEDITEIIGQEPTILNALECLGLIGIDYNRFSIDSNSTLNYFYDINNLSKIKQIRIDLSKPLIKDLDEETITFLHSVLCKKI